MFFDSLVYLLFFPAVWLVYQFVPDRQRWIVLLVASIAFYTALRAPVLLLSWAGVVVVSYYCGRAIARKPEGIERTRLLWFGIVANIGVLCAVKYLHPFLEFIHPAFANNPAFSNLFLTLGVSYYTLQSISYLADIYCEIVEPEQHFGRFALYLGFFPKLLQGPIERAGDLLPQLSLPYHASYENLRRGVLLFAWGLFLKVAVANRLATYVGLVYEDVHAHSGIAFILTTYMYAIQILADFSGYTNMALGVALLFNIRLTQNFNSPYSARSVADFWRRWHISFSRWILDYVFKPLQMGWRNAGVWGTVGALLVTFTFSGLWHGASWNFAVWGLLHGVFLAASVLFKPGLDRAFGTIGLRDHPIRRVVQVVVTFNLVAFAWIFFRANSLSDAGYIVTHLFSGVSDYVILDQGDVKFASLVLALCVMFGVNFLRTRVRLSRQPLLVRWSLYYLLILAIAHLGIYNGVGFVYLQF